jgi:hypothetical protein
MANVGPAPPCLAARAVHTEPRHHRVQAPHQERTLNARNWGKEHR